MDKVTLMNTIVKPSRQKKDSYVFFKKYETRWRDIDVYGHMNNVVFYEFVDSIINFWLNTSGALSVPKNTIRGLVVQTKCDYFSPLFFPHPITCGLRLGQAGKSSVTYEVGLFAENNELCSAQASFVHVYVNSENNKPVVLPKILREALITLKIA